MVSLLRYTASLLGERWTTPPKFSVEHKNWLWMEGTSPICREMGFFTMFTALLFQVGRTQESLHSFNRLGTPTAYGVRNMKTEHKEGNYYDTTIPKRHEDPSSQVPVS